MYIYVHTYSKYKLVNRNYMCPKTKTYFSIFIKQLLCNLQNTKKNVFISVCLLNLGTTCRVWRIKVYKVKEMVIIMVLHYFQSNIIVAANKCIELINLNMFSGNMRIPYVHNVLLWGWYKSAVWFTSIGVQDDFYNHEVHVYIQDAK